MADLEEKRERLKEVYARVMACTQCALHEGRTKAVFGAGSADARLMFVGEAPGYHEDQQGIPFVGQAGKLLDKLLARIGMSRQDVFIANVLKCRPPNNRDPLSEEIELCQPYLQEQIDIIDPVAICTLGNFATKLLSGKPDGISRVRGRRQPLPGRSVTVLFPVFHPAAALYTPANVKVLESDFDELAKILGCSVPGAVVPEIPDAENHEESSEPVSPPGPSPSPGPLSVEQHRTGSAPGADGGEAASEQLGLF